MLVEAGILRDREDIIVFWCDIKPMGQSAESQDRKHRNQGYLFCSSWLDIIDRNVFEYAKDSAFLTPRILLSKRAS